MRDGALLALQLMSGGFSLHAVVVMNFLWSGWECSTDRHSPHERDLQRKVWKTRDLTMIWRWFDHTMTVFHTIWPWRHGSRCGFWTSLIAWQLQWRHQVSTAHVKRFSAWCRSISFMFWGYVLYMVISIHFLGVSSGFKFISVIPLITAGQPSTIGLFPHHSGHSWCVWITEDIELCLQLVGQSTRAYQGFLQSPHPWGNFVVAWGGTFWRNEAFVSWRRDVVSCHFLDFSRRILRLLKVPSATHYQPQWSKLDQLPEEEMKFGCVMLVLFFCKTLLIL